MEIVRMRDVAPMMSPRGVAARRLVDRPSVSVVNLEMKAGEAVPKHTTPVDVFFYVVRGKGRVDIGEEHGEVEAGDIVISPAGIPHGLSAAKDSDFSVLVVKTPNPANTHTAGSLP